MKNSAEIVAFGGSYLDINASGLPFGAMGIGTETEMRTPTYDCLPGGSGINFSRALKGQEVEALFLGMRGDDVVGDLLETLLKDEGIHADLQAAPGKHTNVGIGAVGKDGSHVVFSLGDANQELTLKTLLPRLEKYLPTARYLYMGTLYKLDRLAAHFCDIIALAHENGVQVVVDHGRITPSAPEQRFVQVREAVLRADYYLPSRAEFLQTWGVSDAEEGLRKLAKEATTLCVILKDGAQGAHYVDKGKLITVPAQRVNSANNASGAGDSFNAGFLSGLLSGEDLRGAVEGGCKVAAEHISKS